jgi:hypothetical protein
VLLAWRDGKGDGATRAFTNYMDFGGVPPTTLSEALSFKAFLTTDRETVYVFFAPAAALWARTTLPSMAPKVKSI